MKWMSTSEFKQNLVWNSLFPSVDEVQKRRGLAIILVCYNSLISLLLFINVIYRTLQYTTVQYTTLHQRPQYTYSESCRLRSRDPESDRRLQKTQAEVKIGAKVKKKST